MVSEKNNIGLWRLVFATMVIFNHAPLIFGAGVPEPRIGLLTSGGTAVSAFFIISGYLLTQSWLRSRSGVEYLAKRVLRIYPAFIAAHIASIYLARAWSGWDIPIEAWRIALLQLPVTMPNGLTPNDPLWTISYEFRCYLLVALLGALRGLRRTILVPLALCGLCGAAALGYPPIRWHMQTLGDAWATPLFGNFFYYFWLMTAFCVGMMGYLFRELLASHMTGRRATMCFAVMLLFSHTPIAQPVSILFGGAALWWLAFRADLGRLQRINSRWDISYGTYLYGTPVLLALLAWAPGLPFVPYVVLAVVISWLLGAISWHGLERWLTVKLFRRHPPEVGQVDRPPPQP